MRLIDANALYEQAANTAEYYCGFFNDMENVISARDIEQAPTIDAVPVVRCRDCKHRYVDGDNVRFNVCELNHNRVQSDDWFCADGERKDDDQRRSY